MQKCYKNLSNCYFVTWNGLVGIIPSFVPFALLSTNETKHCCLHCDAEPTFSTETLLSYCAVEHKISDTAIKVFCFHFYAIQRDHFVYLHVKRSVNVIREVPK
jgi:hypothetical protein